MACPPFSISQYSIRLYKKQLFLDTVNQARKTMENQTARLAIFDEVFCTPFAAGACAERSPILRRLVQGQQRSAVRLVEPPACATARRRRRPRGDADAGQPERAAVISSRGNRGNRRPTGSHMVSRHSTGRRNSRGQD